MKKIYMLLAAVLLMVMTGCGSGDDSKSPPSSAKAITAFSLNGVFGTINEKASPKTISITMPYGTNVTALVPAITHTGASISPASGAANDFTTSQTYTVTAADASTQDYQVTVTVSPRSGSLDPDFGTSGMVTTTIESGESQALALVIQPSDNKIVAAGSYCVSDSKCNFALVRYNANGAPDTTFNAAGTQPGTVTTSVGSVNDEAFALVIQPDGLSDFKIVVAGASFNSISNKYDFALVRYNANGTLDTTFNASGTKPGTVTTSIGSVDDKAFALVIQTDDSIVVSGISYNGISRKYDFALVKYTKDGILDTTFNASGTKPGTVTTSINGSINDYADALRIQPSDNKIVVAGYSRISDSKYDFALVRYNTDGSLDTTFNASGTQPGIVTTSIRSGVDYAHALVIQPSGNKIVVAGSSSDGGDYDFALVRYNADGTLDTTFNASGTKPGTVTTSISSGWDVAYALGIQSDGKILVAGSSSIGSFIDFPPDFALVRYNTDGSLDDGTSTDSTPADKFGIVGKVTTPIGSGWDEAYALVIQPDGLSDFKILVAGRSQNVSKYDFALVRYLPQ